MDLARRFLGYIRKRGLVSEGERVLVAVSGGVDSVVLLHLFKTVSANLRIEIVAAHFDHRMRAESSDDAQWVADLCEAWSIPLIRSEALQQLRGETDARAERYAFLLDALRESVAQRAATAHHADDQVETVLMRLLRGAGLRGLSGIPVRRGPFIRPLLRFTKQDLLHYATHNHIEYREDASNADDRFMRNRIRNLLLPVLDDAQPGVRAAIARIARHAARTEKAWHTAMLQLEQDIVVNSDDEKIELARGVLLEYDAALRARVMRHFLRRFGVLPSRSSTQHIVDFCVRGESGSALEVAGRVTIERAFDRLRMKRIQRLRNAQPSLAISTTDGKGRLELSGATFDVAWSKQPGEANFSAAFDDAVLKHEIELRGWRAGDRIRLPYGSKKLKKLFAERRIAVSDRARIPILVDHHGQVLWVAGVARSVHALAGDPNTVLNIMVSNAEHG